MADAAKLGVPPILIQKVEFEGRDHPADNLGSRSRPGGRTYQDGALEAIPRQNRRQMIERIPFGKGVVRVDTQLENETEPAAEGSWTPDQKHPLAVDHI